MLIGNLTRTPELRTVGNGAQVCDLGLAINRSWTEPDGQRREEVTFVDITVWGRTAENAAKFLTKGRSVFVEGRLQLDTWKDAQTGQDRSKLRVIGDRLQFLGGAGSQEQASDPAEPAGEPAATQTNPSTPQRGRYQQRRAA